MNSNEDLSEDFSNRRSSFRLAVKSSLKRNLKQVAKKHLKHKEPHFNKTKELFVVNNYGIGGKKKFKEEDIIFVSSTEDERANKQMQPDLLQDIPKIQHLNAQTSEGSRKHCLTLTNYEEIDYGGSSGIKISSWSIGGVEKFIAKRGTEYFSHENSHIFCLQDLQCTQEEKLQKILNIKGYNVISRIGSRISGMAVYFRILPNSQTLRTKFPELDNEKTVLLLSFDKFRLLCISAPDAGVDLVNLMKKVKWHRALNKYIKQLKEKSNKPLIIAGNFETALHNIDVEQTTLKHARKLAGFTREETNEMQKLLSLNLIDTFRCLHPDDREGFTFFKQGLDCAKRKDYFFVSKNLLPKVEESVIRSDIIDFAHTPITLFLNL